MVGHARIFLHFVQFQQLDIIERIVLTVDLTGFQCIMRAVEIHRVHIGAKSAEEILIGL